MNIRRKVSLVLVLAAIMGVAAGVTGCTSVLAGYDMDTMHGRYNEDNPLPRAILIDVQRFVTSKRILSSEISDITFGEDHKGRHVATITREIPESHGERYKEYILYYNTKNERTNVKTFYGTREKDRMYSPVQ